MSKKASKKKASKKEVARPGPLYDLVFAALHEHVPADQAAIRARRVVDDFNATKD